MLVVCSCCADYIFFFVVVYPEVGEKFPKLRTLPKTCFSLLGRSPQTDMIRFGIKSIRVFLRLLCFLLLFGSFLLYVFRYVRQVVYMLQSTYIGTDILANNRARQDLLTDYLRRDAEVHPFQQMYSRPVKVRTCSCCGHTSGAASWKGWGKGCLLYTSDAADD